MKRYIPTALLGLAVAVTAGCEEMSPTASDPALLPVAPTTVGVDLSFSEFGTDVQRFDGFGRTADLNQAVVAFEYAEALEARTVVRFAAFPEAVTVPGSGGVVVTDSTLSFVGGRIVVLVDSATVPDAESVELTAAALEVDRWDAASLSWTMAVDTVDDALPWDEPGAGPVRTLRTITWDPAPGDTLIFEVDSATVTGWADSTAAGRGLRLSTGTPGVRLELTTIYLDVDVRPSVRPDTLVVRTVVPETRDFVYAPPPPPPGADFRVGGAPSWRTTFRFAIPDTLHGPPALCEAVGCPFELTAESVNYATLTLQTAASPPGFQPDDTLTMDVRSVLSEEDLPKSPLGGSLVGVLGYRVAPEFFGDQAGEEITVGVTPFVQDLIRGETPAGDPAPNTLALLSYFEPLSVSLMTFEGPGPREPTLRLVLTTRVGVPLR